MVQEHYPERGFMVFVVNVPYWFTSVWAVVKTWINPRTLNKIRILGKDYKTELFKFVDPANLPAEFGGTNKFPVTESAEGTFYYLFLNRLKGLIKGGQLVNKIPRRTTFAKRSDSCLAGKG